MLRSGRPVSDKGAPAYREEQTSADDDPPAEARRTSHKKCIFISFDFDHSYRYLLSALVEVIGRYVTVKELARAVELLGRYGMSEFEVRATSETVMVPQEAE